MGDVIYIDQGHSKHAQLAINQATVLAIHATDHQHPLNGTQIRHKIAHNAKVVISNDNTFLPKVDAHFDVD